MGLLLVAMAVGAASGGADAGGCDTDRRYPFEATTFALCGGPVGITVADDLNNPVGFAWVVRDADGHRLESGVACGETVGGVPGGAVLEVYVYGATGPFDCLAYGQLGWPPTTGWVYIGYA